MPEISRFFGIVIRMFFDDHDPPNVHVEYQGHKAKIDFGGNMLRGDLGSRTALKLAREWLRPPCPGVGTRLESRSGGQAA